MSFQRCHVGAEKDKQVLKGSVDRALVLNAVYA